MVHHFWYGPILRPFRAPISPFWSILYDSSFWIWSRTKNPDRFSLFSLNFRIIVEWWLITDEHFCEWVTLWLYRVRHSLDLEKRISLSVGDLEGNIFVVNVVMGLMEIAAVTVLMFNLDRLRKISPKFRPLTQFLPYEVCQQDFFSRNSWKL